MVDSTNVTRRRCMKVASGISMVGLVGCLGGEGEEEGDGEENGSPVLIVTTNDSEGEPIESATVTVNGRTAETDENAQAHFEDMEAGTYQVEAEHEVHGNGEAEVEIVEEDNEVYQEVILEDG